MKAIIITLFGYHNYGNRLQNYAAQVIMEKLGFDTETICIDNKTILDKAKFYIKLFVIKTTGYRLPKDTNYWKCMIPRIFNFKSFNKIYIHTKYIKKIDEIGEADYYVIGSDQVWNTSWFNKMFLLPFAEPQKRVCFSPSFGTESLSEEWRPLFKEELSKFPMLSSREAAGARIIKELTGKDAEVTIDPTLMLDKNDWDNIAEAPKNIDCNKKYILTYFLGGRSPQVEKVLQKCADILNAQVYNLVDYNAPDLYKVNPSGFIYLVSRAELIMTDSFHACVFSFIYSKPFFVFDRLGNNTMMSRMDTLFDMFDLKRKYLSDYKLPKDILECDYSKGYQQLEIERQKLLLFLKKSMNL